MASARKVLTVVGTRPEAIKLFPVARALARDWRFTSLVCTSGQHRELVDEVLDLACVRPDHDLAVMEAGQSLDRLTTRVLAGMGRVLDAERPDWVVVQGDTTTAMASALAAYHRHIPIVHVEAGLRSGDLEGPWPEEGNRRIIAALASLHCAPTTSAAAALRREGIAPGSIHVTGNTVVDALHWVLEQARRRPGLTARVDALQQRFDGKRIIAVTAHRRENLEKGLDCIAGAVRRIAMNDDVAVICPVHPNPKVGEVLRRELAGVANVALVAPLSHPECARLLSISTLVLTDSGGLQEEAPALGRPVLVMRDTTERPEGIEAGTARLVGTDPRRIVAAVDELLGDADSYRAMATAHNPYGDGHASGRIVELLAHKPLRQGQQPS